MPRSCSAQGSMACASRLKILSMLSEIWAEHFFWGPRAGILLGLLISHNRLGANMITNMNHCDGLRNCTTQVGCHIHVMTLNTSNHNIPLWLKVRVIQEQQSRLIAAALESCDRSHHNVAGSIDQHDFETHRSGCSFKMFALNLQAKMLPLQIKR